MRLVALDTTTREGSAALVDEDRVIDERRGDATRTHAERLPGDVIALADANGIALAEIDLFAVASGPGSFTGLRVGIATIQGLAFVHRRKVVGVSALEALAQAAACEAAPGTIVGAWMDAHRRDVFGALYQVTAAPRFDRDRLAILAEPSVGDPRDTMAGWIARVRTTPQIVVGDGAVKYAEAVRALAPEASVERAPLLAGAIGRIAVLRARHGEAVDPAGIQPLYIRRPDAELDREKRAQGRVAP